MPSITKVIDIYRTNSSLTEHRGSRGMMMQAGTAHTKKSSSEEDKKSFKSILAEKIKAV